MTLSSNESWGDINNNGQDVIHHLICGPDERIIGFFGKSDMNSGFACEFGIITAPRGVVDSEEGLPDAIYDMPELMNIYAGSQEHSEDDDSEEEEWEQ
jgi:hypothetical protein